MEVKIVMNNPEELNNQPKELQEQNHNEYNDYIEEEMVGMFFLGMMDNVCSICAQEIIECFNTFAKLSTGGNKCRVSEKPHQAHIECIEKAALKKMNNKEATYCCDCQVLLSDEKAFDDQIQFEKNLVYIMKTAQVATNIKAFSKKIAKFITEEFKDELIKVYKVYKCKSCDHTTKLNRGEVNYKLLDKYGKPISEDAAINCNLNKIECENCHFNFCNKCKTEPYHIGHTCEGYQEWLKLRKCRFCRTIFGDKQQNLKKEDAFDLVCNSEECIKLMHKSCHKTHDSCKHFCGGTSTDANCLPCLDPYCVQNDQEKKTYGVHSEEYCMICYTDVLGQAPSVQLNCNHLFHQACIDTILTRKYNGNRISFGYLDCPACGVQMASSTCSTVTTKISQEVSFKNRIYDQALNLANREKLFDEEDFKSRPEYENNRKEYAMLKLAMYKCHRCSTTFCGGRRDCEAEMNDENQPKPEDIMCVYCAGLAQGDKIKVCDTHGQEYMNHKCQFCCTPARWFCFGAVRYCEPCHNIATTVIAKKCPGKEGGCPYDGDHLPNGKPYSAGCKMCKILEEEKKEEELRKAEEALKPQENPIVEAQAAVEEGKVEEELILDMLELVPPQPVMLRRVSEIQDHQYVGMENLFAEEMIDEPMIIAAE
eukprot:403354493